MKRFFLMWGLVIALLLNENKQKEDMRARKPA